MAEEITTIKKENKTTHELRLVLYHFLAGLLVAMYPGLLLAILATIPRHSTSTTPQGGFLNITEGTELHIGGCENHRHTAVG
jgi:hypothetical protein